MNSTYKILPPFLSLNFSLSIFQVIKRFIYTQKQTKLLIESNNRLKKIFEITPNLTILTDGEKIIQANNKFLEFMHTKDVDSFHNQYSSISEIFSIQYEYLETKRKGLNWIEYIAKNDNDNHQVKISYDNKENNFLVHAVKYSEDNNNIYIVVFENITKIHKIAYTDQLTSLANRMKINNVMNEAIQSYTRYKNIFTVILLDIDHFKVVNDKYGHLVGDEILQQISCLLKKYSRSLDLIGRWGGEEFILILKETNLKDASIIASKICTTIESHKFNIPLQQTISLGVSEYKEGENIETLLRRTDEALYRAKNNGRNRVEISY